MEGNKKSVIIVGGGVAGLAAGATLVASGKFEVTLLEASNRLGGRVYTEEFGSHFVEIGAEWIHGQKGNPVYKVVHSVDSNLLDLEADPDDKCWSDVGYIYTTQNGEILSTDLKKTITHFLNVMEQDPNQFANDLFLSKGEVAIKYNKEFGPLHPTDTSISNAAMNWIERYLNSYDCADSWDKVSYSGTTLQYIELPGILNIPWKAPANSSTILKIILEGTKFNLESKLEKPSWVHLDKEVVNINYSSKDAVVACSDGSSYSAHYVICTIPLGILKNKQKSLFNPSLPEKKKRAIEFIGYETVNKLYFEFDEAWWPKDFKGVNLLWVEPGDGATDGQTSWLTEEYGIPFWCRSLLNFHTVETHPRALRSWLTGRAARFVETLDDDYVRATCMKVMRRFLAELHTTIPEPIRFMASRWNSNPFSGGTYSCRTVTSEKENVWAEDIAAPILNKAGEPVLCFAGEATDRHFYSSMHGAYASGIREAERLIQKN